MSENRSRVVVFFGFLGGGFPGNTAKPFVKLIRALLKKSIQRTILLIPPSKYEYH